MENPNEYDDEAFSHASIDLFDAITGMWEAGGSEDDIMAVVNNAIKDVIA
jgi:hypothetical protein